MILEEPHRSRATYQPVSVHRKEQKKISPKSAFSKTIDADGGHFCYISFLSNPQRKKIAKKNLTLDPFEIFTFFLRRAVAASPPRWVKRQLGLWTKMISKKL